MRKNAFTLIELIVVVVVCGSLTAIAISSYQNFIIRAKLAQIDADYAAAILSSKPYLLNHTDFSPLSSSNWQAGASWIANFTNGAIAGLPQDRNDIEFGYCMIGSNFCFHVYTTTGYRNNPATLLHIHTNTAGEKTLVELNPNNPWGPTLYGVLKGRGETVILVDMTDQPGLR